MIISGVFVELLSRDGRTMRGVWAADEQGLELDGATWKSSRHAQNSIDFGLLARRGRGVVEFSARRVGAVIESLSTGADVDEDGKLGLVEIIYIMQIVAGLR